MLIMRGDMTAAMGLSLPVTETNKTEKLIAMSKNMQVLLIMDVELTESSIATLTTLSPMQASCFRAVTSLPRCSSRRPCLRV